MVALAAASASAAPSRDVTSLRIASSLKPLSLWGRNQQLLPMTRGVHKFDREARVRCRRSVGWGAVASAVPSSEAACARVFRLRRRLSAFRARLVARAQRPLEGTRTCRSAPRVVDPAAAGAALAAARERPAGTDGAEPGDASSL